MAARRRKIATDAVAEVEQQMASPAETVEIVAGNVSIAHCSDAKRPKTDVDCQPPSLPLGSVAARLLAVEKLLGSQLEGIDYGPKVDYVYNPLSYAEHLHTLFLAKFLVKSSRTKVLFLGMNPGPFGMCQTGIPFGEVTMVRDWMKITGPVNKPAKEFPKRPVLGMDCKRAEPSGKRFWSFFAQLCGTPERFFMEAYVHNYCPIAYLDFKGKNVTPVDMKVEVRRQVETYCDAALIEVIKILGCDRIVGIGKYAEEKARKAAEALVSESPTLRIDVASIMHPSPANPNANGGKWEISVNESLKQLGLIDFFK